MQFTRQLIKNSENAEIANLRKKLRERIKENVEKKENNERLNRMVEQRAVTQELNEISKPKFVERKRVIVPQLFIPEPRIPQTISGIRPVPIGLEIDLGKLNDFLKDQTVVSIECSGSENNLVVRRTNGEKRITSIKLTTKEIREIINKFSKEARVPATEGIFKAVFGRLIISAIISDSTGDKFLISKISR